MNTDSARQIRPARKSELAAMPEIERSAAERFTAVSLNSRLDDDTTDLEELSEALDAGLLWCAIDDDRVVGFAVAHPIERGLHLEEVDVLPRFGGRGFGAGLVRAVCDEAASRGLSRVTLTTFRDVPFNRPFYEKLGFRVLAADEIDAPLAAIRRDESDRGLDPTERVVMERRVAPTSRASTPPDC